MRQVKVRKRPGQSGSGGVRINFGVWTTTVQDQDAAIGSSQTRGQSEARRSSTDDNYICIQFALPELAPAQNQRLVSPPVIANSGDLAGDPAKRGERPT